MRVSLGLRMVATLLLALFRSGNIPMKSGRSGNIPLKSNYRLFTFINVYDVSLSRSF